MAGDKVMDAYEIRREAERAIGEDRVPTEVLARLVATYGDSPWGKSVEVITARCPVCSGSGIKSAGENVGVPCERCRGLRYVIVPIPVYVIEDAGLSVEEVALAWSRIAPYLGDPPYPEPMIDTRRLRAANDRATDDEYRAIRVEDFVRSWLK